MRNKLVEMVAAQSQRSISRTVLDIQRSRVRRLLVRITLLVVGIGFLEGVFDALRGLFQGIPEP